MVPPGSHKISRVPWYSGTQLKVTSVFAYEALTLYRRPFQDRSTNAVIGNFLIRPEPDRAGPHNPAITTPTGLTS